jgi:hypothetical protein
MDSNTHQGFLRMGDSLRVRFKELQFQKLSTDDFWGKLAEYATELVQSRGSGVGATTKE